MVVARIVLIVRLAHHLKADQESIDHASVRSKVGNQHGEIVHGLTIIPMSQKELSLILQFYHGEK